MDDPELKRLIQAAAPTLDATNGLPAVVTRANRLRTRQRTVRALGGAACVSVAALAAVWLSGLSPQGDRTLSTADEPTASTSWVRPTEQSGELSVRKTESGELVIDFRSLQFVGSASTTAVAPWAGTLPVSVRDGLTITGAVAAADPQDLESPEGAAVVVTVYNSRPGVTELRLSSSDGVRDRVGTGRTPEVLAVYLSGTEWMTQTPLLTLTWLENGSPESFDFRPRLILDPCGEDDTVPETETPNTPSTLAPATQGAIAPALRTSCS